jgi:hypothetical protein
MNEKQLIAWLEGEKERSAKDCRMASDQEWIDYHEGEYDAFSAVLQMIGSVK